MKYLSFFIIVLTIFACKSNNPEKLIVPENIISRENFVELLADIQLVEAALREETLTTKKLKELSNQYYDLLFEKHHITKQKFDSSLNFYKQDLVEFDKIYQDVISKLEQKKEVVLE